MPETFPNAVIVYIITLESVTECLLVYIHVNTEQYFIVDGEYTAM